MNFAISFPAQEDAMTFDQPEKLSTPTGATLSLRIRRAEEPARGVLQINHGLAEHSARYERFAAFMAARGFDTYAHDHRGHGYTKAPGAPLGHFGSEPAADKVIADILAVHDRIAEDRPSLPVIVFGHSMGGLIALNFILRHPLRAKAAAIWNANFSAGIEGRAARAILAWERFRLGSDVPSRLLPRLTFGAWNNQVPDRRTEFNWLSRDEAEVEKYIADPLCGWPASVGMWRAVFDFIFLGADDRNFVTVPRDMPFNLTGGAADPSTGNGKSVTKLAERLRKMGFSDVVSNIYAETRHESLNELNRDIIMEDFATWALRQADRFQAENLVRRNTT